MAKKLNKSFQKLKVPEESTTYNLQTCVQKKACVNQQSNFFYTGSTLTGQLPKFLKLFSEIRLARLSYLPSCKRSSRTSLEATPLWWSRKTRLLSTTTSSTQMTQQSLTYCPSTSRVICLESMTAGPWL